jgi:RimJ/RimL family protein N-acetyltransferase
MEDRYKIMQWRNEQIYHLRQAEPLTKDNQDWYFENVVVKLFQQDKPNQLLFSFLKGDECIGYGGLVHINWVDKHAEISFIMETDLEKQYFQANWKLFLGLIQKVAFDQLTFHKIFTYAFDLRPQLYPALEEVGFKREAVLSEHCFFNNQYLSVIIHSKLNKSLTLREASKADVEITFKWAKDPNVRKYAISQDDITWDKHQKWFDRKIKDSNCFYFLAAYEDELVGSFRLDMDLDGVAIISYLLDPAFHGRGLGKLLLEEGINRAKTFKNIGYLIGFVIEENRASVHLFQKLNFTQVGNNSGLLKFKHKI